MMSRTLAHIRRIERNHVMFVIVEATDRTTDERIEWAYAVDNTDDAIEKFRRHFDEDWVINTIRYSD